MEKRDFIFLVLISFVFVGLYTYNYDKKIDLNGDNANYYMLGKALAQGEGYVNIADPGKRPNNHFPPGYPSIVAVLLTVFPDSFSTVKLANGAFLFGSLLLCYYLIKKFSSSSNLALFTVLCIGFNAHLLRYSTMMMTEVPFLFFGLLALFFFLKTPEKKPLHSVYFWLCLLVLIYAYYIRSLGIALIGAFCLQYLIRKNWMAFGAMVLGFLAAILPWQIRSSNLGGNSYVKQLLSVNPYRKELGTAGIGDFIERIGNNFTRYVSQEIPNSIFPFISTDYESYSPKNWVIGLVIIGLAIYGIKNMRQHKVLLSSYIGATLFILLLWPDVWIGVRFILPLSPILLIGVALGLNHMIQTFSTKTGKRISILFFLPILLWFWVGIKDNRTIARAPMTPGWKNYFQSAKWVNKNLPNNTVVACRKPTLFYLESESLTTNYKYTKDDKVLLEHLAKKGVNYVVLDQLGYSSTYQYLLPAIQKNPEKFEVVYKLDKPETYLLKFNP